MLVHPPPRNERGPGFPQPPTKKAGALFLPQGTLANGPVGCRCADPHDPSSTSPLRDARQSTVHRNGYSRFSDLRHAIVERRAGPVATRRGALVVPVWGGRQGDTHTALAGEGRGDNSVGAP